MRHNRLFGIQLFGTLGVSDKTIQDALAMMASVEAIFLSTFVLISQNRMAAEADKRADLDLQISLLTEHELSNLASVVNQIAQKLQVEADAQRELDEAARAIAPERVLDRIEETSG